MDYTRFQDPRSQTLFGNADGSEISFRTEGVSACAELVGVPARGAPPPCETEFRSQVRSQTEFGNESVATPELQPIPRTPQ